MGKSRKKFLKKEKAKVKLKGSKTVLPKGQNLTDTNFKVKKIVIKDQLKPHVEGEVLSSRKQTIKDLLARLKHHNVNMRKEALDGLNEIISVNVTEVIQTYISMLLQDLSKLTLDPVGSIRKEAIKLMANLFSNIRYRQLEPFFVSLSSYLVCGLTHIDFAVREDSLYFLDILLKYIPTLCAKSVFKLLPVCLDLVSHKDTISRSLSLDLNSSLTTKKWRNKVLSRIRILLTAVNDDADSKVNTEIDLPIQCKCYPYSYSANKFIFSKLQLDCIEKENESRNDVTIMSFSEGVIPLLLDIFIEVVPQKEDDMGQSPDVCTVITEEDGDILANIVDIMMLLWDIIEKEENSKEKLNSLSRSRGNAVISKLIKGKFPYATRSSSQSNKKRQMDFGLEREKNLSCRTQNLTLCKLVLLFGRLSDWNNVLPYLKNTFRFPDLLNSTECDIFISCISIICQRKNYEESRYFLTQVSKTVVGSKSTLSNLLFMFLSDIALDRNFSQYLDDPSFNSWLESLPKLLTKPNILAAVLEKLCQISIRRYKGFTESLDAHIEVILDNIPRVQVEGMPREQAHMKIASLLYYVSDWDEDLLQNLKAGIENEYWGSTVTSHIRDILNLRLKRNMWTD